MLFYTFSAVAIFSAIACITRTNCLAAVQWFCASLLATNGLCMSLASPIAAASLAITTLAALAASYFFVTSYKPDETIPRTRISIGFYKILSILASGYLGIILLIAAVKPPFSQAPLSGQGYNSMPIFAQALFGDYIVPLELLGLLILVVLFVFYAILNEVRQKNDLESASNNA